MLDLRLFGRRTFAGANVAALVVSLAMFGIFFFVSLYMQNILGYTPVHTGVIFLPMTALVVASAPLAGKGTDLIGPRWPISAGMLMLTVALLLFSRPGLHASFSDLLPGMLIGGLSMGRAMGPMTTAALSTAPVDDAGVVSGVITTSRQVGGALGIAVMGAIVAAAETLPRTIPTLGSSSSTVSSTHSKSAPRSPLPARSSGSCSSAVKQHRRPPRATS